MPQVAVISVLKTAAKPYGEVLTSAAALSELVAPRYAYNGWL